MSKWVLSPPFLLILLLDQQYGPLLMCAILCICCNLSELRIDQEWKHWGHFELIDENEEATLLEQQFHKLLKLDKNKLVHILQQLGLWKPCCIDDLQKVSKVDVIEGDLIKALDNYPVVFECLVSNFLFLPSASHLAEQVHGMLCHSLKDWVSLEMMDCMQSRLGHEGAH